MWLIPLQRTNVDSDTQSSATAKGATLKFLSGNADAVVTPEGLWFGQDNLVARCKLDATSLTSEEVHHFRNQRRDR